MSVEYNKNLPFMHAEMASYSTCMLAILHVLITHQNMHLTHISAGLEDVVTFTYVMLQLNQARKQC